MNDFYLECFEQREDGRLHVDIWVDVGAGRQQVLERVAQRGSGQVEAVDDGQRLEEEERVAALTVALEYDDRHDVRHHAEHDQHADHVQLHQRLNVTIHQ